MRLIAMINQKGGTGKTTTAVNLSAGLARVGYRTLLLDLDPQGHATLGLGVDPDDLDSENCLDQVLHRRGRRVAEIVLETYQPNLFLAPATIGLSQTAMHLHSQAFRELRLRDALKGIEDDYDYIVADCQPTFDVLPINAIVAADHFVIPTPPAGYALRGLRDLLDTLQDLKGRDADAAWDWRVLLTMVIPQARVTNEAVDQVLAEVADHVLATRIHRSEALNQAQTLAAPRDIFASQPRSRGATDYRQLVEEVVALWPAK